jgi:hypothetical protein
MPNEKLRKTMQERSGASDEQLDVGEMVGKVRGRDLDPTFHDYSFTDPETGEPLEVHQVVHEVPVGVSKDGKLETAPMTDEYAQASKLQKKDAVKESASKNAEQKAATEKAGKDTPDTSQNRTTDTRTTQSKS